MYFGKLYEVDSEVGWDVVVMLVDHEGSTPALGWACVHARAGQLIKANRERS